MTRESLAPLLASAQASHAALVAAAKASTGAASEDAWALAGQSTPHRRQPLHTPRNRIT